MEDVSPAELVSEAVALVHREVPTPPGIDVSPSLASAPSVRVVPATAEQVLANLLTNAAEARHGSNGKPTRVVVGAAVTTDGGRAMVDVQVSDDGPGIAPEALDRVFEPGFTTKRGGAGLGLHWSANAVCAMGGRMYVENPGANGGACFHVLLPAADGTDWRS